MDSESNNQIDQLLRRQGRNAEAPPIAENGGGPGFVHLDADELNAFASNALPAAARMRYAGHLADCADCRRQMTQVALAVNPSSVHLEAAATAAPASSIWQKLAYFIKPPTLRYTGPILAVLCVAVIMGVVLRSQYGNRMLNEQTEVKSVPDASKAPAPVAPNANVPPAGPATPVTPGTDATPTASPNGSPTTPGENQNGPVSTTTDAKEETVADKTPATESAPVVTSPPPAPPKDVDAPGPNLKGKIEDRRKSSDDEVSKPNTGTRNEGRVAEQKQEVGQTTGGTLAGNDGRSYPSPAAKKSAPAKGGPSRSQTQDQVASQRDRERNDPSANSGSATDQTTAENRVATKSTGNGGAAAATRSVSGRQFRRQGNVWVDTAYGGGATTVVRRGSDQYRGLVADEPGMRAVAEQLAGEVVVVWKGRAYRIK